MMHSWMHIVIKRCVWDENDASCMLLDALGGSLNIVGRCAKSHSNKQTNNSYKLHVHMPALRSCDIESNTVFELWLFRKFVKTIQVWLFVNYCHGYIVVILTSPCKYRSFRWGNHTKSFQILIFRHFCKMLKKWVFFSVEKLE